MDDKLIYKIASSYYRDNESQENISARFGISRIKVSRVLKKAREEGIVRISLHTPADSKTDLERELADAWSLDEIILTEDSLETVGSEAWKYFRRILRDGDTVALSWGTALSAFADAAERADFPNVRIVQMVGGMGSPESDTHSSGLVMRIANFLGAVGRILPAPGIVESEDIRSALLKDEEISRTLELAASADIAVVGIGLPEFGKMSARNAVGDIAFRFFSDAGGDLTGLMEGAVIGTEWCEIKSIRRVIAAACGSKKREAVAGALKTGLVNVLITDEGTGEYLYEIAKKEGLL